MKILRLSLLTLSFLIGIESCSSTPAPAIQIREQQSLVPSQQIERRVLTEIDSALTSTGQAARLYYQGTCQTPTGGWPLFPEIDIQTPAKDLKGLEAVRAIFRNDSNVVVSEDTSGIIRIRVGNVATAILDTPLPILMIDELSRYKTYPGVIGVIENTEIFETTSAKLNVSQVPIYLEILSTMPAETDPHLPATLKDTTVDQVLDLDAETFRGTVVYGECLDAKGKGYFDISFHANEHRT